MAYRTFDEIELPIGAVTTANPAHVMDFRRYASDQVVHFNRLQTRILRRYSPGRAIIHNFMGRVLDFDHFDVGCDLDVASWDSCPPGFLEDRLDCSVEYKRRFGRAGDPDFQAFHHDLMRAIGDGRWWVMEQQPGPVNWARHNPAPHDGMVRLWTWEAIAHGAETVSYFRWRQAPFAQEQMHTGLLLTNGDPAAGFAEVARTAREVAALDGLPPAGETHQEDVLIIFDYPSAWAWEIQPHGSAFDYFALVFDFYRGLRRLGIGVDFARAEDVSLAGYRVVIIAGLFCWPDGLREALAGFAGRILVGPRSGSKTADFSIPPDLPPCLPPALLDARVIPRGFAFDSWPGLKPLSYQHDTQVNAYKTPIPLVLAGWRACAPIGRSHWKKEARSVSGLSTWMLENGRKSRYAAPMARRPSCARTTLLICAAGRTID